MSSAINTKTTICNLALSHIRQTNFLTSPNDNSEQAVVCNLWYDICRRDLLRACNWLFARSTVVLMQLGDINTATQNPTVIADQDIIPGWIFTYKYPAQCVAVRAIFNPVFADFPDVLTDPFRDQSQPISLIKSVEYGIGKAPVTGQQAIGTNLQNASAQFTADITDESQFDDSFVTGLSYELALKICLPLTADKELFQLVEQVRDKYVGEAKRINGGEATEKEQKNSEYIERRNA